MSWTYLGQPFVSSPTATQQNYRDTVRFLLGDTNSADPQLQDGEIDGLLYTTAGGSTNNGTPSGTVTTLNFDPYQAAMAGCITLAASYARKANRTVGDLSIQSASIAESYRSLRKDIMAQSFRHSVATPYAGGQSLADMQQDQTNDDINPPQFSMNEWDNTTQAPDFNTGGGFSQVVPG